MKGDNRRKRLNLSIKRRMQIRLFLEVLSIVSIGIGLMAVIFYVYSNREIGGRYGQFHIHARNFLDYLLPAVILSMISAFLFAIAVAVFFPHRIAGPLFRIERDLKEKIGEGDLTVRFTLRKGDEVSDLADAFNTTLDKLRLKLEGIKKPAEKLEALITDKNGTEDKGVYMLIKEINEALRKFRL